MKHVVAYKKNVNTIKALSINQANSNLASKAFRALFDHYSCPKSVASRKARTYRRQQLLAPSFVGLKRQCFLNKMHNEIREISSTKTVTAMFSHWMNLSL